MKTSNKLLLMAYGCILAGVIFLAFKIRTIASVDSLETSGVTIKKEYALNNYTSLKVWGSVDVELYYGNNNVFEIEGDSILFEYLEVANIDSILTIKLPNSVSARKRLFTRIPIRNIDNIEIEAGGKIVTDTVLYVNNLKAECTSGGNLKTGLVANDVEMEVHSGGSAKLYGEVNNLKAQATSGGSIKAKSLQASNAQVEANAGGVVFVNVTGVMDVICNSGGLVKYTGEGHIGNVETNSGGRVSRIK